MAGSDDDTLTGSATEVSGTSGNDMIDPWYTGDPEGDRIDGAGGPDLVRAGDGDDTVVSGIGDDTVFGGTGDDKLYGEAGDDLLDGEDGNDALYGGEGADTLNGGAGQDTLYAGAGDLVSGGADTDTLVAGDVWSVTFDPADATSGTVTFADHSTASFSGIESLVLNGGALDGQVFGRDTGEEMGPGYVDGGGDMIDGNDQVIGGLGPNDDYIFAMGGDDTVHAGEGNDSVFGGDGNDAIYGDAGDDSMQGDDGDDTLYGGLGDDYIRGDVGNDHDYGGVGNDTLYGGKGNDWIEGAEDNDSIFGGYGDDTVFGGVGDDTITGSGGNDSIFGGDGDDSLQGSNGSDTIFGGAGADSIFGEEDADVIYAGSGDYVDGGSTIYSGNDEFVIVDPATNVDNDSLYVTDVASVNFDVLNPEQGTILFNDGGTLTFYEIENVFVDGQQVFPHNFVVEGTAGNDTIDAAYTGDAEGDRVDAADNLQGNDNDTIRAFGGNDRVEAGAGNDSVFGGDGNDSLFGGAGSDTLMGEAGGDLLDGGDGNDSLVGGDGDDCLTGGEGDDTLSGGAGSNSVHGGAGNDVLLAGAGHERLDGGTGDDTLIVGPDAGYGTHVEGGDGTDTLDLSAAGPLRVIYDATPGSGTVEFLDAHGAVEGTLTFAGIERCIVPCFTPGALVMTDRGEVAVEHLLPGDRVMTRDYGFQPLRWTARRDLTADEVAADAPGLAPVRIAKGALGPGLPAQDMVVSPQHRMLLGSDRAEMLFGQREVLAPALHLVGLPGITREAVAAVSYIHLLFDRHQIVSADGVWSESFQPGARTLGGLDGPQREEVLRLFPWLSTGRTYPPARVTLKAYETQVLMG
ncbi:MAG: Hint domain-containing protein [Paracoccaceae bacterium]